ncbi:hypothetical protein [Paraburkholderia largidicola]|uniref:Uncharacterized protein n=1 Tax=Paraburkholderia largidicola TaxID=3014751 RepID=A0A7I8C2F9_9BURK|nr:hypothetical protein [Paraburkholderia sp. PGU16]BCF95257.1 hypothetical protein PPGU16_83240 [Paraburkholderia sp. PGU16]
MFGLYPAGAQWVRHFSANRAPRDIGKVLTVHGGFNAGIFHTPFGEHRGAVIAQSGRFLILAAVVNVANAELAVVPDVQMQNLLWSFETGYANQWGPRELLALTGVDNWDGLIRRTSAEYAAVCKTVEGAVDGALEKRAVEAAAAAEVAKAEALTRAATPDPVVGRMFPSDDDAPWLPSDYLFDAPEVQPCAH